ncbi:MAG: BON domain-containing protein [bacterium]
MKTDVELRRDVIAELAWEPRVNDEGITTVAHDGVITLSGTVDNYVQRRVAEMSAGRVAGVRAVVQELNVHLPNMHAASDIDVAQRVLTALEWDTEVPHQDIQVHVENGFVALTGTVQHDYQRRAAELAVSRLGGIRGIRNLVDLAPHASGRDIERHIKAALHRSAESDARHIIVQEQDGRVTLLGKVRSFTEREDAERAAWSTAGVMDVDDRITITF